MEGGDTYSHGEYAWRIVLLDEIFVFEVADAVD